MRIIILIICVFVIFSCNSESQSDNASNNGVNNLKKMKEYVRNGRFSTDEETLIKDVIKRQFSESKPPTYVNSRGVLEFIKYLESEESCKSLVNDVFSKLTNSNKLLPNTVPFFKAYLSVISKSGAGIGNKGCVNLNNARWKMNIYTALSKKAPKVN